jgi:hypothetical protein
VTQLIKQYKKINLNPEENATAIHLPDCFTRIAEIAYYKAESRGVAAGCELDDWCLAEREFMLKFRQKLSSGESR